MRRKAIILFATIAVLALAVVVTWPRISFYMLTGRFSPIDKIETLHRQIPVTKWSSDGLHLADGRTVQLPGLRSLPSNSPGLAEATRSGVEVGADGRVWGLVRVYHWCGNDPVREHVARVDLSHMMIFLSVGEPLAPVPETEFLVREPGGTFTEWGWRIGEFMQFQAWESIASRRAESIQCVNNMVSIGMAARMWANDRNERLPPSLMVMSNEVISPKILHCPGDHTRQRLLSWAEFAETHSSYEVISPGAQDGDTNAVFLRCKVHGHSGYADGTVFDGKERGSKRVF